MVEIEDRETITETFGNFTIIIMIGFSIIACVVASYFLILTLT